MSRYEPRLVTRHMISGWVAFDTQENCAASKESSWSCALTESARLNRKTEQKPAPKLAKPVDRYRDALMRISRNSTEKYAQEVADQALTGGSGDRNP
jgi:hypothetical protein